MIGPDDYDDYEDEEADFEPDPQADYEPDPADSPEWQQQEYRRYLRCLPPHRRVTARIGNFIWRYTWRWRIKPNADEPPF